MAEIAQLPRENRKQNEWTSLVFPSTPSTANLLLTPSSLTGTQVRTLGMGLWQIVAEKIDFLFCRLKAPLHP
jgi:hypothetical protein